MTQIQKTTKSQKPKFPKVGKDRLTLLKLFEERSPIWVRNLTGTKKCRFKTPGAVILQLNYDGGGHDKVVVPPGVDPICLSDMTDYGTLQKCSDLYKQTQPRGVLELLDPAKAEKYYELHEGRAEKVRSKLERLMTEAREDVRNPEEVSSTVVQVSTMITELCLKIRHAAIKEEEALERLIERAGMFNVDDWSYLLANGQFASIKKYAKEQLDVINGQGPEEEFDEFALDEEIGDIEEVEE